MRISPPSSSALRGVAIVNPRSFIRMTGDALRDFRACFDAAAGPMFQSVRWLVTGKPGDAELYTRQALRDDVDVVISVGGDGTHNEVVNGFFEADGAPVNPLACMAVLHRGTGGDFRKSLGIGPAIDDSLAVLCRGKAHPVDVGILSFITDSGAPATRRFINIASVGIAAVVDRLASHSRFKRLGGKAVFAMSTAEAFLRYRNRTMRFSLDGGAWQTQRICNLVFANGRYFGGGMMVAPHAELDDGLIDVVSLGDFSLWEFIWHAQGLYAGKHLSLDKVWWRRAKTIRIESDIETWLDIDGDSPGRLPAEISVAPHRIQVYANTSTTFEKRVS